MKQFYKKPETEDGPKFKITIRNLPKLVYSVITEMERTGNFPAAIRIKCHDRGLFMSK